MGSGGHFAKEFLSGGINISGAVSAAACAHTVTYAEKVYPV